MTEFIVDASVVIQHLITEPLTPHANALFGEVGKSIQLYAPEFCIWECTNVLWKHVRFHGMPQSQAEQLVTDVISLPITIVPTTKLLPRALQIGLSYQLAIYDSAYIALAGQLTYPLITADTRQAQVAQTEGISLKALTDFKPIQGK